ncbi:MAG: hypothetical protein IT228_01195 [Flavobacteriales bacterium]|nr:hypothetical protein [Flavobacteriales bacterium]NUQ13987.1 hypothetical protein [Flavobacteriales bacterium]
MTTPRIRSSTWAIAGLMVLLTTLQVRWAWIGESGHDWENIVRSDVRGYYGYLLAVFIRHDLGHEPAEPTYVQHTADGTLNKYFAGTAVMMAPWFAAGHALALMSRDAPKDGRSGWEFMAVGLGGLVHVMLGLLLLRALLTGLGVRDATVGWVLVATTLATPLLQYATMQPGWSHVHSFLAFSAFLYLVHRLAEGGGMRWMVLLGAVLGLIVLIRPVNGLVVLAVPMVAGRRTPELLRRALRHPKHLALALAAFGAVVAVQPVLWHAQTGHWLEWGYRGEGFHWDRPEVLRVLFGFRRGLFLYAPVLLLAMVALVGLRRRTPVVAWSGLLYFGITTYVIASWWIWYYGSGFGSRVYIEHLAVLAVPWALWLDDAGPVARRMARSWMALCILFHGFQYWQFHHRVLHHESMDRHKYAWAFGRHGTQDMDRLGGNYQAPPYNPNGMSLVLKAYTNLETPSPHWTGGRIEARPEAYSGRQVCVYDGQEFGITFIAGAGSLPVGRALHLEVSAMRYEERAGDSFAMQGVAAVQGADGGLSYYEPFRMNLLPGERDRNWTRLCYAIPLPPLRQGEEVRFYFWDQHGRARMLVDDLRMKVFAVNPYGGAAAVIPPASPGGAGRDPGGVGGPSRI